MLSREIQGIQEEMFRFENGSLSNGNVDNKLCLPGKRGFRLFWLRMDLESVSFQTLWPLFMPILFPMFCHLPQGFARIGWTLVSRIHT